MKVLIIRFSSMGDVILVTPLFSYLRRHFPDAEIFFLTASRYTELFNDEPRLTSVIPFSRSDEKSILSDLASQSWDFVIDLQNNRRSSRIRKKYFSKVKIGIFDKLHVKRFLLLCLRLNLYGTHSSVAERYIQASGVASNQKIDIPPVQLFFNNKEKCKKLLISKSGNKGEPVIALMPFSAWKNKQWPLSSYSAFGRHFIEKKWNVVILGGPDDVSCAEKLKNEIGKGCISLAGKINLYDTGGILNHCRLALGNDTGLSHLARACGVRTGIIYGATTYHFGFFPFGSPPFKIFQSPQFCRPCHPHGGNVCWRFSRSCLKKIEVNHVIDGLEELLLD